MIQPGSIDDLRRELAPAIAAAAAFDGWSDAAVRDAATARGVDPDAASFAFAEGSMTMIEAWVHVIDAAMAEALPADRLAGLKVRERIAALVRFRLDVMAPHRESLRRALAVMALPGNAPRAVALGWRSADAMWRLAGDTATDYNHYTKRAMLGSIYAATLMVLVDDASEGHSETLAFLDRRIDGVMRFEKAKARLLRPGAEHFSPVRFLGHLRYGTR